MDQANTGVTGRLTIRGSRDALLARAVEEADLSWRILNTLNLVRGLLALSLLALFFAGMDPQPFGSRLPPLYTATASAYLVFAVVFAIALRQRWGNLHVRTLTPALVDIAAITTMMYTSEGVSSGLGGLLVVFIGAGSLALGRGLAPIVAAIATFAILGAELLAGVAGHPVNFPAAGIISAMVFSMAMVVQPLGRRIQQSEALARQRGVDLRNLAALNEYIVQHLRESILVIDADGTIHLSNESAMQLLGSADRMNGKPLMQAAEPLADYILKWRRQSDLSSHTEITLTGMTGSPRITAHLAPLGKDNHRGGPVLVFLEDTSLINERVQQSKLASLGRLSASIAHEIRNPVGAMSHAAQLLAEADGMRDEDLRLTEIIQTHSERVSHIIDNVLQLSRRDSSRPEHLALKPWLAEFVDEFVRTHELQEGQLVMLDVADDIYVRMDPGHLRQILWNLCDNAIKYASETGGISVELRSSQLANRGRPYLEVCDRGNGVDTSTAEKIFEPFYTERSGGTGLGLYISRELCELNRATLFYLDRSGGGSIFRIVFADPDRWERLGLQ